ncbi:2,3-bisphosphoglycerate-independent phosphoglycerate mutase [Parazoarcus communis]|uniref:2,3-bisphosphoglycerate-independent phosphoglycerate mutase n=1 Tax=Parazoarcus communis SWub3 = DSM 12120 TaxID=1121029 RepID=A0A323UYI4_9RHOO|nr:2,3-bisphosphoglycerate-independent phosphoglycerate mutase [Parazoarcus communis]NMG69575.1 2,3-bisphosphoglycerate-independent phosphoglycerate mutase [Parazoarcus communis SWub3 = DSM 12120]PZA17514.1 2,3-bisphosphoglycerate-independent phosphoglycerate mutase [Azoarcus communis] [Parazoarcus communis SWub3 = DSM 12120]
MLQKHPAFAGVQGPVVVIVLDGYGIPKHDVGSAIDAARKPTLDRLLAECPNIRLRAHGTAVGMPSDDDMGNSEVGHNAIGAGQVYAQGAALVANAIAAGTIWEGSAWQEIVAATRAGDGGKAGVLHFIGLFSDGNVHSHIDHLKAMVLRARDEGVRTVRIHALLDGRDVPETSALEYVVPFEAFLRDISTGGFDARIASGGGRQTITMDRYDANWPMVARGWRTHVLGEGPQFANAVEAVNGLRARHPGTIDQDLPEFIIAEDGKPIGTIEDGDSVVFYNFRGDRAIEITRAFVETSFSEFDRVRHPKVTYAGMLQYDGDLQLPKRFLVAPPAIKNTSGEWFSKMGLTQFACSETQKFGHVTYFWNGNRSNKFDGETWQEVPSDVVPFEQRPWMKAAEITDAMIAALQSGQYKVLRCNYANGDMVGHTGNFRAATMAIEAVDLALARLLPAIDAAGGVALITADHGNADEMFELDKKTRQPAQNPDGSYKAKTAHTLNPVPLILYGKAAAGKLKLRQTDTAGLSNIAATVANLLGLEKHETWDDSLLDIG